KERASDRQLAPLLEECFNDPDVAEAEDAERLAVGTSAYLERPAAGSHFCVFPRDLTRALKDESPGHLDGGACVVSRMRHRDTSLSRGLHIAGRVARTGRCDQLQSRQAPDDRPWQRCALAHDADHVERQEALDHVVEIGKMSLKTVISARPASGDQ